MPQFGTTEAEIFALSLIFILFFQYRFIHIPYLWVNLEVHFIPNYKVFRLLSTSAHM